MTTRRVIGKIDDRGRVQRVPQPFTERARPRPEQASSPSAFVTSSWVHSSPPEDHSTPAEAEELDVVDVWRTACVVTLKKVRQWLDRGIERLGEKP